MALPVISTEPPITPPTQPPYKTVPAPLGARIYVSVQGDWWDVIAMKVYGFKRGNEALMYRIIEANYHLRDISLFPAGIAVIIPKIESQTEILLVPWKVALLIP